MANFRLLLDGFWDRRRGWQMVSGGPESISVSYICHGVSFAIISDIGVRSVHHLFFVICAQVFDVSHLFDVSLVSGEYSGKRR